MVARFVIWLATAAALSTASTAVAVVNPFIIGGRAEYRLQYEKEPTPFNGNVSGNSAVDRTRLMLDIQNKDNRYGLLYLKGSAIWDDIDPASGQKSFRFDQGDYLWQQQLERWDYGVRLFANERRFFVYDRISPMLDDDAVNNDDNLGIRLDSGFLSGGNATALYSMVDNEFNTGRQIAYLKAGYDWQYFGLWGSYLFDDPGDYGRRNRASLRVEMTGAYRWFSLIAAFERTDADDKTLFLPDGSFDFSDFNGPSTVVSPGDALHAELRVNPIKVPDGRLKFVWRYDLTGSKYNGDFSRIDDPAVVSTTPALFYRVDAVNFNARALYNHSSRNSLESETRDIGELGVWTTLRNGTDLLARARVARIDGVLPEEDDQNFIHVGARYTKRKVRSGIHVMWKDIDTDFYGLRYAWDGKITVSANWRFQWRVVTDNTVGIGDQAFLRVEYRPNNRLYFVASYGREYIGDGPFVLEDRDVGLSRANDELYRLILRGDF